MQHGVQCSFLIDWLCSFTCQIVQSLMNSRYSSSDFQNCAAINNQLENVTDISTTTIYVLTDVREKKMVLYLILNDKLTKTLCQQIG